MYTDQMDYLLLPKCKKIEPLPAKLRESMSVLYEEFTTNGSK